MDAICDRRVRYVKAGYEVIPCVGKSPVLDNWPTASIDADIASSWSTIYPFAANTGVRTRHTPAIDLDIYDDIMGSANRDRAARVLSTAGATSPHRTVAETPCPLPL